MKDPDPVFLGSPGSGSEKNGPDPQHWKIGTVEQQDFTLTCLHVITQIRQWRGRGNRYPRMLELGGGLGREGTKLEIKILFLLSAQKYCNNNDFYLFFLLNFIL